MPPDQPLIIRAFSTAFVCDKMRDRKGPMRWLQLPVRLTDPDYRAIAGRKDGATALGVWLALLELAGSLDARDGVLARSSGEPLTIAEIASMTGLRARAVAVGIEALRSVGWITISGTCGTLPNDSETRGTVKNRAPVVEGSGVESRGAEQTSPPAARAGAHPAAPPATNGKQHPDALPIATMLGKGIRHWKPDAKVKTDSRASLAAIDRMLRIDKRDPVVARSIIRWLFGCEQGDYAGNERFDWRPNINSGTSLRRAWDKLEIQMNNQAEALAENNR